MKGLVCICNNNLVMRIGIDYGSKLAGTTVISYRQKGLIYLERSVKNQDADQMIMDFALEYKPEVIGIDAPLSLPGVYREIEDFSDYHYRVCDRALKAMSPMFLGGLTARAMKLQCQLGQMGATVYETYPVETAKRFLLEDFGYRTKQPDYQGMLDMLEEKEVRIASNIEVTTSHDLDSILALVATDNIGTANEQKKGDHREGLIYH